MGLGGDRINLALSSDCLITDPVGKNTYIDEARNRKLFCYPGRNRGDGRRMERMGGVSAWFPLKKSRSDF